MGTMPWQHVGQGRGPTPCVPAAGSAGEALLSSIQKAAEVVANAVRPGPGGPSTQGALPRADTYQAAVTPSASHGHPSPGDPRPGAIPGARGIWRGSCAPGAWTGS